MGGSSNIPSSCMRAANKLRRNTIVVQTTRTTVTTKPTCHAHNSYNQSGKQLSGLTPPMYGEGAIPCRFICSIKSNDIGAAIGVQ